MGMNALLTYLEARASDFHRATVSYDGDSTDMHYIRADLREELIQSGIDRMLQRLRPESSADEERAFPFGDLYSTVRVFDEAIILHFPTGNDQGIVVSLEPETAQNLNTFIGDCQQRIQQ